MVNTRQSKRGRNPTLRNEILSLLASRQNGITMKEIAEELHKDETTPFRPLKDLVLMGLVETDSSESGVQYYLNRIRYDEFNNNCG